MTDTALTVILAAIPTTIGSITAAIVALAALRKTNENGMKADDNKSAVAEVSAQVQVVHAQTNSVNSKLSADLSVANERIQGMERQIALMNTAKHENAVTQAALLDAAIAAPAVTEVQGVVAVSDNTLQDLKDTLFNVQRQFLESQEKLAAIMEHERLNRKVGTIAVHETLKALSERVGGSPPVYPVNIVHPLDKP